MRWALVMMRLCAACRKTSVRGTKGTAPDEMTSASTWRGPTEGAGRFAADVEGYSRLMGADEVVTLKRLTERRVILDVGDLCSLDEGDLSEPAEPACFQLLPSVGGGALLPHCFEVRYLVGWE